MVAIFRIIEGIALLTLGRKLFWLFVAAIGFEVGMFLGVRILPQQPDWVVVVSALCLGIFGAGLALVLQNLVVGIAGFIGGGIIAMRLLDLFNLDATLVLVIGFVVGGAIGALLVVSLFDWALITLSSLVGAATLTDLFLPRGILSIAAICVLFIIGVSIQAGWLWSERRSAPRRQS